MKLALPVLTFALSTAPSVAFNCCRQVPAFVRLALISKSGFVAGLSKNQQLFNKKSIGGVRTIASTAVVASMFRSVKGGGGRDYSDLESGTFPAETAEYALANEVKSISKDGHAIATFGGGCFWGVELMFQRVPGVVGTAVGYTQGDLQHPSYEAVCSGMTGHTEVVQVSYRPAEVSMKELTALLFGKIDPTLKDQVGNDAGSQYRHGVYYHTPEQRKEAEEVFAQVKAKLGSAPIYTELKEAKVFFPAEEYHQRYLEKGGRAGRGQSAAKGCRDPIRCYG